MKIIEIVKKYAQKAALTAALGTALLTSCQSTQPTEAKKEFKPSASASLEAHVGTVASGQRKHTLRTCGLVQPFKGASLGYLLDETTAKPLPLDSASSYLQLRPNYDVLETKYGKLGIVGMLESGPGFKDRLRLGVSVTPKIPGLFTQFRVFPLKSGKPGIRVDNFTAKRALDGILALEVLSSYRKGYQCDGEHQFYGEAALKCDISKLTGVKALEGLFAGAIGKYGYDFVAEKGHGQLQGVVGYKIKLP